MSFFFFHFYVALGENLSGNKIYVYTKQLYCIKHLFIFIIFEYMKLFETNFASKFFFIWLNHLVKIAKFGDHVFI